MLQLHLSYWINSIYTEHCSEAQPTFPSLSESARIVKSARFAKAAAGQGETAHVTCRARGAPGVTFSWSRGGDVIDDVASAGKYSIERKRVRLSARPRLRLRLTLIARGG